ncbi:hypothetical protein MULP_03971 [Mycobacterium liflandii 128FXT]|uniref:Uncharacterized protein n=2 Tax=Mycobacterium ulcerans group TaxID=2993898 RepID=A0A9N7LU14_9MYCO|nr:hypothetical protein MULP_03971 [Mycobacterium liflandii 128FXT]BBA89187.1 hypothetical protein MPSD_37880 [Mycobacterium pseudoshottsii JCM 15466]BDN83506.1 hypothetical protein NJB1907Z4_C37210 [Mycobacterium pseudoshottsii]BEH77890.1 hypothetical protein YM3MPS_36930 [Mycobacterium pseudoshottsii]
MIRRTGTERLTRRTTGGGCGGPPVTATATMAAWMARWMPCRKAVRGPPACLHPRQLAGGHPPDAQRRRQHPGGGHRVGQGQVDPDAADRGHRVRRIADAQRAVAVPAPQPIELYIKQFHVIERLQCVDAVGEPGHQVRQRPVQCLNTLRAQLGIAALGNDVGDLVVVAAVDGNSAVT